MGAANTLAHAAARAALGAAMAAKALWLLVLGHAAWPAPGPTSWLPQAAPTPGCPMRRGAPVDACTMRLALWLWLPAAVGGAAAICLAHLKSSNARGPSPSSAAACGKPRCAAAAAAAARCRRAAWAAWRARPPPARAWPGVFGGVTVGGAALRLWWALFNAAWFASSIKS